MNPIPDTPAMAKFKAEAANLASAKRFTDNDLEAVYAHAFNIYQQRQFDKALQIFAFLTTYRPASAKYRKGLAACQKMLGLYADAEQTYTFLLLLDPNDAEVPLGCAECLIRLGNHTDAVITLEGGIALAKLAGRADLQQRAEAMLAALNSAPKSGS
jgi:type III secretion system low calcium response chaperone LcrH/SycD